MTRAKRDKTMYIRVLNVGDGACTVFTLPWDKAHFVVDCGATSGGKGTASATILSDALGETSRVIENVMITHFDKDHWAGILAFPDHWMVAPHRPVTMRYPNLLPKRQGRVQAAHLLFQSALVGSSITPITSIINAWRRARVVVYPRAVKRGDAFTAVGRSWTVHWPPADSSPFTDNTRGSMKAIEDQIEKLAREFPEFGRGIDAVYEDWRTVEDRSDRTNGAPLEGESDTSAASAMRALDLDEDALTQVVENLSAYTNTLSIVHSTDTVINFGDCQTAGLSALLRLQKSRSPDIKTSYNVVFAPHHGTRIPGVTFQKYFPHASEWMISQNGDQNLRRANRHPATILFKATKSRQHVNIHEHGHLYIPDSERRPPYPSGRLKGTDSIR